MIVLGIESSCDDTGVALFDSATRRMVHAVHSQISLHVDYGGVVPELASRDHVRRVLPLIEDVLARADARLADTDAIAVTAGPGLAGALLVGCGVASALGYALQRPVVAVHHLEGHLLSPLMGDPAPSFPFVCLLVSGGHTQLLFARAPGRYELLGETLDDAAGEAFDKTAQMLGLGYPGGPEVSRLAAAGTPGACPLPRPMLDSGTLEMSFSGLKTAVRTAIARLGGARAGEQRRADIARGFVDAVVDVLAAKAVMALRQCGLRELVVAGGVGANRQLRARLDAEIGRLGGRVYYPPPDLCTDNGAMIAFAGWMRLGGEGAASPPARIEPSNIVVRPRWDLKDALSPGDAG
jgi:N6-L-threonylcarbamoyladenine synthase